MPQGEPLPGYDSIATQLLVTDLAGLHLIPTPWICRRRVVGLEFHVGRSLIGVMTTAAG
jgi:hypothetical protein